MKPVNFKQLQTNNFDEVREVYKTETEKMCSTVNNWSLHTSINHIFFITRCMKKIITKLGLFKISAPIYKFNVFQVLVAWCFILLNNTYYFLSLKNNK